MTCGNQFEQQTLLLLAMIASLLVSARGGLKANIITDLQGVLLDRQDLLVESSDIRSHIFWLKGRPPLLCKEDIWHL
jgi:hypothetical protein